MSQHFISASCREETCQCGRPASHKIGEEIPHDDPSGGLRHNFTAYVCCACFSWLMGRQATKICFEAAQADAAALASDGVAMRRDGQ